LRDKAAAAEEHWPEIEGVHVKVKEDGSITVTSPYAPEIRNAIAAVPTARWDPAARVWTVMAKYRKALRKALVSVAGAASAAIDADRARLARAATMRRIGWREEGAQI